MSLTLKDIARMAGVAESTVSRAINNKPGVGQRTKKRIMEIVEEYNYQPNQLAQG
ncbi:MAG: LacI family DNA-binding transcriptional regulator, partial [Halanaerobiales bacterium]